MENAEPTNDVLPDEFSSVRLGDPGKGFSLDPLSEVVNGDNGKSCAFSSFLDWTNEVNAPLGEWPRASYYGEALRRLPLNIREALALVTFLDKLARVPFQGQLEVALMENLVCQSHSSGVIFIDSLMDFPEYVCDLFAPHASEK